MSRTAKQHKTRERERENRMGSKVWWKKPVPWMKLNQTEQIMRNKTFLLWIISIRCEVQLALCRDVWQKEGYFLYLSKEVESGLLLLQGEECVSRKLTILRVNNELNQPWLWPPSRKTSHLQCTTMGPAYDGLTALTFLRNFSMPMGENGTPKSGQLVKWSWVTSRGARGPSLPCCEAQTHKGYTCAWIMIAVQTHIS